MPIDINPHDLDTVRNILHKHVPQLEVRAFGSRIKGTAKAYSDLDLVVMSDRPLPLMIKAELNEDFSESDLPFKVDVLDWHGTKTAFRKLIEAEYHVIQEKMGIVNLPDHRPLALLLRHAEREAIRNLEGTIEARLVPAGKAAARAMGRAFAPLGPLVLRHSPVPRCAETAEELVAGALEAGGRARLIGPVLELGGPYMYDWRRAMKQVFRDGADSFVRSWFAGELPSDLAMPAEQAAKQQLQILTDSLKQAENDELCLHVSHDWNVLCLRTFFAGRDLDCGWPRFLEPVAVWNDKEDGQLRFRSADADT